MEEILSMAPFDCRGPTRPAVVDQPSETVQDISNPASSSHSNNRVGCFKIGMGSSVSGLEDRRLMVCSVSSSSHQLLGTSSSLSSPENLYKREERPFILLKMDNITALTYINRMGTPIGGPPFPSTMLLSLANVDLVPGKKHFDQSRASSKCDECGSGLRESDVYSQGQV